MGVGTYFFRASNSPNTRFSSSSFAPASPSLPAAVSL
jgi:hypothetical protein